MAKSKRKFKVELTLSRPSAITDKQLKAAILDSLTDLFGEICIDGAAYHLPAYVSEIKVI